MVKRLAVALVWCGVVLAILWTFRAGTTNVPRFSSDTAIPLLMANDARWDLFQCFYYGQDRFGAWPFLTVRVVGRTFNSPVSWGHLQLVLSAWVCLGSVPFAQLAGSSRALMASLFLGAVALNPHMRILFDASQPYGWQLTAILMAWWCTRLAVTPTINARFSVVRWLTAGAISVLATWSSLASGPVLVGCALLEAWRLRLIAPVASFYAVARRAVLVALIASLFEIVLRLAYHQYAKARFDWDYHTALGTATDTLGSNIKVLLQRLVELGWTPLLAIGAIGGLSSLIVVSTRPRGMGFNSRVRDLGFLTLGCAWIAVSNLIMIAISAHIRDSNFAFRYFPLVLLLGSLAGLTSLAMGIAFIPRVGPIFGRLSWAIGIVGMSALGLMLPPAVADPTFATQKELATELARRAPKAVLLSDYWETYELAALVPGELIPLPFEGLYLRMPWNVSKLAESVNVIVGHYGESPNAHEAQPVFTQYGTELKLVARDWYSAHGRKYDLYLPAAPVKGSTP